jgi:tetratricopeptide (TPR) repeat protein
MERHLSCSEWVRVLSGPAGTGVDAAVAHLASCGPCWDGAAGAVAELKRRGEPLCFQDARSSIVGVIESEERAASRWLLARTAWIRLKSLDAEEQVKRLKADPALQTREMFDTVLAEASKAAPDDPYLGEERAQVAHALAGFLPEGVCPRPMREDLQGAAMLTVANSRRLAADWTGSASASEVARRHFAQGTGEPAREARLLSIQASLASDTGHLEKSLTLLARASEIARCLRDPAVLASLAVKEANTFLAAFRYEEAITRAEEALGLLARGEARLEMLARSIVTESLAFLGRLAESLRCFSSTLPLYEQVAGRRTELRRAYLEALLLDSCGFFREAEKAFRATIAGFMAAEQYKDAFLVLLTYFEGLVRKGLLDKAERVCEEALGLTKQAGSGCHGQMIDLWRGLLALLQAGHLVKYHLVEAREYLVRSWHVPAAQGPLRQPARTAGLHISAGGQEREQAPPVPEGHEPWLAPKAVPEPEIVMTTGGYQEEMERLDRALVAKGLAQCGGHIRKATHLLGMARDTLRAKIIKYGLKTADSDGLPLPSAHQHVDSLSQELRTVLEGMRARACWWELASLPAEQQIRRLETVASLRTPEMLDTVLATARSAAREDPALGEQRAQVAHALAGLLPASCCSRRRRADLQGEAMLIVASCRRQAGDFSGSAAALDAASRHFGRGTGDASQAARLLSLQASLAADTGHAKEALDLLAQAAAVCRRARESAVASITIKEANTLLGAFRYEEAVTRAEAALRTLAPGETRLELLAKSIITESLALLGRPGEALRSLFNSLTLYERLSGHRTELQLGYLEALVLDSLGYVREAEDAFRVNIAGWMEAEHYKDALLIQLTQFERLYRRGEIESAARVCREALRLFEEAEPDRHRHILELWRGLLDLVENRGLTDHKLLEARDFAMAAFAKRPDRAPEPPAPSPVPEDRLLRVEPAAPVGQLAPGDYKKALEQRDRQLIAAALDQCQGRVRETCRRLGISEPTLRAKMTKYGLKGPDKPAETGAGLSEG